MEPIIIAVLAAPLGMVTTLLVVAARRPRESVRDELLVTLVQQLASRPAPLVLEAPKRYLRRRR
jgi:hypothetical protein